MALPPRIPKKAKRSSRWRSTAHCNFVRSHACSVCHSTEAIEVAHVRMGSGAGMGQKPDDWRTVSLCRKCHAEQHRIGEDSFWGEWWSDDGTHGWDRGNPYELIEAFCKASPKAAEIRAVRNA